MKLRNKKTGESGYYLHTHREHKTGVLKVAVLKDGVPFSEFKPHEPIYDYDSLTKLNEEWEDVEEPKSAIKDIWFNSTIANGHFVEVDFISDEEAEKAVEKLKAWKRLKDKGFEFEGYILESGHNKIIFNMFLENKDSLEKYKPDLDLLFGGEE